MTQVAVVVLLLVLAVPALSTAHEAAGTPLSFSESLTVNYSSPSSVSENSTVEGYGDDPTISIDGQTLTAGTDYSWNATNGDVTWFNTTNSSDGDTASIDYRAYQRTAESSMSWTVIAPLMSLFGLFALISTIRAVWGVTAEVWGL